MFGPIKTVVFDFDGTLVDTMSSVVAGLTEAVRVGTGRVIPRKELVATFGGSPLTVLRHWMDEDKIPAAMAAWIEFEQNTGPNEMRPFDGVADMLESLKKKGIVMGVFTGRDRSGVLRIAKAQNWIGKYFKEEQIICGDDGFPAKPSGKALKHLCEKNNWSFGDLLMVGDHPYDMMAGREVGAKVAAALWDMPEKKGTNRSRFKEAWDAWNKVDVDLRLDEPKSLARWFESQK
jgi:pyrophosphatase PpaX